MSVAYREPCEEECWCRKMPIGSIFWGGERCSIPMATNNIETAQSELHQRLCSPDGHKEHTARCIYLRENRCDGYEEMTGSFEDVGFWRWRK